MLRAAGRIACCLQIISFCSVAWGQAVPPASANAAMSDGQKTGTAARSNETVGVGGLAPQSPSSPRSSPFARFDQFLEQGQTSTFPGSEDSVLQDSGGFRTWLADRNIGFQAVGSVTGVADGLPTGLPRDPQRFNGQRPTIQQFSQNFKFTWQMGQLGPQHTQFTVGMNNFMTSYAPNGASSLYLRGLSLYQTLFNEHLSIKAGITSNYYEYIGFYVGGSPILASGVSGLLPIQAGLSADPSNTPLVNITAYGAKGSYIRVGVQRSMSPLGLSEEVYRRSNPFDIDLTRRGAGPLYIGEIGVRRPASSDGRQIWLRMGGIYNRSDYTRFDGGGTGSKAAFYALADHQLTQTDRHAPARGLYVGASGYWIPQSVNVSNLAFEGRVYAIGAFNARPRDTMALRATWTKFSDDARTFYADRKLFTNKSQLNVTASYSLRAHREIYIAPALSYLNHPSFIGDYKQAVLGALQIRRASLSFGDAGSSSL